MILPRSHFLPERCGQFLRRFMLYSKTYHSNNVWILGVVMAVLLLGAGQIGCGNDKNQDKKPVKAAPATSTNTGTGTSTSGKGTNSEAAGATSPEEAEKVEGSGDENRYTAKDFPKRTQTLSEAAIKENISNQLGAVFGGFVAPKPDSEEADDLTCLDFTKDTKWTGNAKSISLKISKKVSCKQESDLAKHDIKVEGIMTMTCPVDAFATIVGKTREETADTNLFKYCKNSKSTYLANAELVQSLATKEDPKTIIEFRQKFAVSKADGTPCTIITTANAMEIAKGCQGFVSFSSPSASSDKLVKMTLIGSFKGVKGPLAEKAPSSGSFDFSINDWKGSATFDESLTPSFEVSDGNSTVRGTLE